MLGCHSKRTPIHSIYSRQKSIITYIIQDNTFVGGFGKNSENILVQIAEEGVGQSTSKRELVQTVSQNT